MPITHKKCTRCGTETDCMVALKTCPSCGKRALTLAVRSEASCSARNDEPGPTCGYHVCRKKGKHELHECVCGKVWK